MCAACSIISVLTQWGATLVIKLREREREAFGATRARLLQAGRQENASGSPSPYRRRLARSATSFAPRKEVVALRSDGAARTAKYQAALEGGHDVLVLISERGLGRLLSRRTEGRRCVRFLAGWAS